MESISGLESDNTFILIPLLQSTNLRSIVHENEISEQSATVTGICTDVFQNPQYRVTIYRTISASAINILKM